MNNEQAKQSAGKILRQFYNLLQDIKSLSRREAAALGELLDDVVRDAYYGNENTGLGDLSGWSLNEMDAAEGLRLFIDSSCDQKGWKWKRLEDLR